MTKKEYEIVEEIMYIAENCASGLYDENEYKEIMRALMQNESPDIDDTTSFDSTQIYYMCKKLLKKKKKEPLKMCNEHKDVCKKYPDAEIEANG